MRYRIIKEANGNDEVHYEVHFYKRVRFMLFFKKWKWVEHVKWHNHLDFSYSSTMKFSTLEEAQKIVNKHSKKRTLESMGEIDTDEAYRAH